MASNASPSRSSLSCCQVENNSQSDVREACNGDRLVQVNNNYFMQEKHQFPKKPEIDLQFNDVRYRVTSWSMKNLRPGM